MSGYPAPLERVANTLREYPPNLDPESRVGSTNAGYIARADWGIVSTHCVRHWRTVEPSPCQHVRNT